jgi:uncharacterized protein (TIGR02246 family)
MILRLRNILPAAVVSVLAVQCAYADGLKETIQAREDQWSAAYNAHDADALGLFYEEDAVLVPPGMAPVHGRAAIAATLAGLFASLHDLALITDEVRPIGDDWAVEIGHSTYRASQPGGATTDGIDNYQVVWHRGSDGVWRYATDMFNTR